MDRLVLCAKEIGLHSLAARFAVDCAVYLLILSDVDDS